MSFFTGIIDDTLKKRDMTDGGKLKWSRTSLTMWSAWMACLFAFVIDTVKHDGNVDGTMFGIMVGVALGAKVTDAWSKKMNPDKTPDDEPKQA